MASKVILDNIGNDFHIYVVDTNKSSFDQGLNSLHRIKQVLGFFLRVFLLSGKCDYIYLSGAQSKPGNIRDLVLLLLTRKGKKVLHIHGGGIRKHVFSANKILKIVNRWIISLKLDRVIVLSDSLKKMYKGVCPEYKIRVLHNCVNDDLFIDNTVIKGKYTNTVLHFLYMSNFITTKGYASLINGFLQIKETYPQLRIILHLAGTVNDAETEKYIHSLSLERDDIEYHGTVEGKEKKHLLEKSHVFCLPTKYVFEGQPISILEAYASGLVVLTTPQGGIPDIFEDGKNGWYIDPENTESIPKRIYKLACMERKDLCSIGIYNLEQARKLYSCKKHIYNLRNILEQI